MTIDGLSHPLERERDGYFSAVVAGALAGTRYKFTVSGGEFPDPASRSQPEGPHGASQVVDPDDYAWGDDGWRGTSRRGQVVYEMHVGTFTREGTWAAAAEQLDELAALGVTLVEMMPIHEFPGAFNWGYDGVDLFAPAHVYGSPDDLRRFVDRAHAAGIGVVLDVVYNHLGPDGNYLAQFSDSYFSKQVTDWGTAINFDGEDAAPVREFFVANAGYWIDEFHFDGLRLDATQNIYDRSTDHILGAIGRRIREAANGRETMIIAENEPQDAKLVRPAERGGHGLDSLWNDDFHHTALVALTGRSRAYYSDHRGVAQELLSAIKWGYLFQGQRYAWQKQRRGTPSLDLDPEQLILFLENHDQVANSDSGKRISDLTSAGRLRAMTALLLLAPGTPMLFQGQEFGSRRPFFYFADHRPELAARVEEGRAEFLRQFSHCVVAASEGRLTDPRDRATFERSKLDFADRKSNSEIYDLHKDLLALRRSDPTFSAPKRRGVDGAVLRDDALVLRYFGERPTDDRLVFVNLGHDLVAGAFAEPLVAPPEGAIAWQTRWSSDDSRYGGPSTPPIEHDDGFFLPAESAVVLTPRVG